MSTGVTVKRQRPALFRLIEKVFCARLGHRWHSLPGLNYCRRCFRM